MNFVCIKDCNNQSLNLFKNEKVYFYKKGVVYDYAFSPHYTKSAIKTVNEIYCGYVTNDFVSEHFMPKYEYDRILTEIDRLYDRLLINENEVSC
jgi:hypothetical protein